MFQFTPLLGAQAESAASQSLLELEGGVKVLVDVGWDAAFDTTKLKALEEHTATLSLILLTHPTIEHLGAYAHCCKHIPRFSQVPVYATIPVINLGRTLLIDLYASSPLAASVVPTSSLASSPEKTTADGSLNLLLQPPAPEDIATYFARINALKYSQPHQPIASPWSAALGGLTITAYGAGHSLGGTIWHIQQGLESIVYAADWNQGRENLLSGATLLSGGQEIIEPLQRPTALICSSKGVERTQQGSRKDRDGILLALIRETIAQGGKVLIPTDSSARVLELAYLLNETWMENVEGPHAATYKGTNIYMASKSSSASVRYLQSMLEWVEESVRAEAEAHITKTKGSNNPLSWKHVKLVERRTQLERAMLREKPCVILASDASLEWGFARRAFDALCTDPKNLVILTDKPCARSSHGISLAGRLWNAWQERQAAQSSATGAKVVDADGLAVEMRDVSVASLDEGERAVYETYMTRQRQLHSTLQGDSTAVDPATADMAEQQDESESESEEEYEDAEHQGRALNLSAQMTQSTRRKAELTDAELGVNILLRSKHIHDYDVRNKRGREKLFPFIAHRNRIDEYGDVIKPEEYLRAEERDQINGIDPRSGAKPDGAAVGQKRKWDDAATSGAKAGRGSKQTNKRTKTATADKDQLQQPDDIDAAIARATGETLPGEHKTNGTTAEGQDDSENEGESDYEPEEPMPEGPQKVVFQSRTLTLRTRIAHVDFTGIHDLRALQMIIPLMRPRKLVLISGGRSETQILAAECTRLLREGPDPIGTDIFTPVEGETVNASVDTNAWTLKLSRELAKRLTWQNVKGLGIVALTGRLGLEAPEPEAKTEGEAEDSASPSKKAKFDGTATTKPARPSQDSESSVMPLLDLPTTSTNPSAAASVTQRVTQPVHVGDLRLADLRAILRGAGHEADFRGEGTLLVDGAVIVRKSASGRVEVETATRGLEGPEWMRRGGKGDGEKGSFYEVRKAIYGGLAVVAGV